MRFIKWAESMQQDDPKEPERRKFHRFAMSAQARIFAKDKIWDVKVIDISLKGVLLERPVGWDAPNNKSYRLEVTLPGETRIGMNIAVARTEIHRLACECERIDFESFTRLKRLVELNLGDPHLLNRELSALG
ncbi:MAG: PilZ domain-containing protein [bacterium]